jgi:CheY-like chemotaxis protein
VVRREELVLVGVGIRHAGPAAPGPFVEARHRVHALAALRQASDNIFLHILLPGLNLLAAEEAVRASPQAKFLLGRQIEKVGFALPAAVRCIERDREEGDKEDENLSRSTVDFPSKGSPHVDR